MSTKQTIKLELDPPPRESYPESVPYNLDWSGVQNKCPTWFRDAKFGIFIHWGPYAVPAFDSEWYSRNMYDVTHKAHKHHIENYGPISQFGYKNFFNSFIGEHFDADAWVKLFTRSGAKYFIPCAEHADGYALWNSAVNPCNSINYGLGRDAIAELKAAAGRQDIKFGASLHHSWLWGWFCSSDPLADVYKPDNRQFYGVPQPLDASYYFPPYSSPSDAFQQNWLAKCKEVVDNFLPDTLYFDSRVNIIEEKYRLEFAEYYLEAAHRAGKQVIFSYKDMDFQQGTGILDYETRWMDDILPQPWQGCDKSVWLTWSYVKDGDYKTSTQLIHQLAEIVSKNGNFLLNIGPKSDGTIDEKTTALLEAIGDWLAVNGEAIYGTRPFTVYGEGPTKQETVLRIAFKHQLLPFTPEDIRFTQKEDALYAILLGWPYAGKASIKTLRTGGALQKPVRRITLLGHGTPLPFVQDGTALTVTLPENPPCEAAFTLKIEC